jgi:hypothetical protein
MMALMARLDAGAIFSSAIRPIAEAAHNEIRQSETII